MNKELKCKALKNYMDKNIEFRKFSSFLGMVRLLHVLYDPFYKIKLTDSIKLSKLLGYKHLSDLIADSHFDSH